MSSKKIEKINVDNILSDLPHVVRARRAKLHRLKTPADIEDFFIKYENSNAVTVRDVFKDGKLDELVGSYCIHSIPLGHLNRAAQALYDFVTDNPDPVEPKINLFDREKRRVLGFVHHILEGYYIPNAFDYVIEHREYYISTWLDVHAKIADISYLPTKYSPEVQQYMFAHLRENHPEIYQGIPENVRVTYEKRYLNKKPKQSTRKAISESKVTQSKESVTPPSAMPTTAPSTASSRIENEPQPTQGMSQSSSEATAAATTDSVAESTAELATAASTTDPATKSAAAASTTDPATKSAAAASTTDPATKSAAAASTTDPATKSAAESAAVASAKESAAASAEESATESAAQFDLSSQMDNTSGPSNEDSPSDNGEIVDELQKRQSDTSKKRTLARKKSLSKSKKRIASKQAVSNKEPKPKVPTNEVLKKVLFNYSALALTVFYYEDKADTDKKPLYLVIMVHFLDRTNVSKAYKVKTCLLSFDSVPKRMLQESKFALRKFKETLTDYDLEEKYLVVMTESNLHEDFDMTYINTESCNILQCNWEILVNSVLKGKRVDDKNKSLLDKIMPQSDEPTSLRTDVFKKNKDDLTEMINSTSDMRDLCALTDITSKQLLPDMSGSHLLSVWFILRGHLKEQAFSNKSLSDKLDQLFSHNIDRLHHIQLVTCFSNPSDLKNWMSSILAKEFEFYYRGCNDTLLSELMKFDKYDRKHNRIMGSNPQATSLPNEVVDAADESSSLEQPVKRQKILRGEASLIIQKYCSRNSTREQIVAAPLYQEVDYYIKTVSMVPDWAECSAFEFWESPKYHLPLLKKAALFYLTIPATIQPSITLLESAIKQVDNISEHSEQCKLLDIINKDYLTGVEVASDTVVDSEGIVNPGGSSKPDNVNESPSNNQESSVGGDDDGDDEDDDNDGDEEDDDDDEGDDGNEDDVYRDIASIIHTDDIAVLKQIMLRRDPNNSA